MAHNQFIDQFVEQYSLDFAKYEEFARRVKELLDDLRKSSAILANVTARAKNPDRLKVKLEKMDDELVAKGKDHYLSVQEVADSIHDLIGARITLYFPMDSVKIPDLLKEDFVSAGNIKIFPPKVPNYADIEKENCTAHMRKMYPGYENRRFDGYHATHYRVKLAEPSDPAFNPDIEIQVASVLMNAWSEVEHDLAYKKMTGEVSREEYEVLDEINGLVIAGEIALNRLNQLSQQRIQAQEKFDTVFELKSYLQAWLQQRGISDAETVDASGIITGNIDLLFNMYHRKDMLTRKLVDRELKRVENHKIESLSELVYWMTEWYKTDNRQIFTDLVRDSVLHNASGDESKIDTKLVNFLRSWNSLEDRIRKILRAKGLTGSNSNINWRYLVEDPQLTKPICKLYYDLRLARNRIVHANRAPSLERLLQMDRQLQELNRMLEETYPME